MKMNTDNKNGVKPSKSNKCKHKNMCNIFGSCPGPMMYLWAEQAVDEGETDINNGKSSSTTSTGMNSTTVNHVFM